MKAYDNFGDRIALHDIDEEPQSKLVCKFCEQETAVATAGCWRYCEECDKDWRL